MSSKKSSSHRLLWWLALAVALIAFWWLRPVKTWKAVYAKNRNVIAVVVATGKLRAYNQSLLSAELAAPVHRLFVDEGSLVKKGQRLALLNQSDLPFRLRQARSALETARQVLRQTSRPPLQSELDQAQADLLQAQSRERQAHVDLQRARQLRKSNSIAAADLDRALFAHEQSRAATLSAKARLGRLKETPRPEDVEVAKARVSEADAALQTLQEQARKQTITAPYNGIILTRHINLGQQVAPGTPLFTLADPKSIEIYAEADENTLASLSVGQEATAIAPAYKDQPFPVKLHQISPQIDAKRGVIGLRLSIPKMPAFARVDLTVDVNIQTRLWPEALSLPIQALIMRENKPHVMHITDRRTRLAPVQLRGRNLDWIVVENFSDKLPVLLDAQDLKEGLRIPYKIQP